jgi:hypothetical protein
MALLMPTAMEPITQRSQKLLPFKADFIFFNAPIASICHNHYSALFGSYYWTQFYSNTLSAAHNNRLNTFLFFVPSIIVTQLLIAMSPLIALFYIIYTGFEPEEVEKKKREQVGDFQLDGHAD